MEKNMEKNVYEYKNVYQCVTESLCRTAEI